MKSSKKDLIASSKEFSEWTVINDTIMGGSSQASCSSSREGLSLKGLLVEQGGGFVSCRSPVFSPVIDLSRYRGLELELSGEGRAFKFAIATRKKIMGVDNPLNSSLRWVITLPTTTKGMTTIFFDFDSLKPTIRAKPVILPVRFDSALISQFQLLHSKFGDSGDLNPGFKPGQINFTLHSISAVS